jgi:hypothetical protein
MKIFIKFFHWFIISYLFVSCSLLDNSSDTEGPNELSGNTNLELTKVGNEYGVFITVGSENLELIDSVYIVKNDNGIVTVKVFIETKNHPLNVLIPDNLKDNEGNVNTELKFKVTDRGIQDFYYSNNDLSKPFTIVKYDAKVGDKYEFTTSDGKKITRTITSKSEVDDFPLGFLYIKTIVTESNSINDGVKKIIYRTNHKFGLVYVEFVLNDGSSVKITLIPWAMV